ncbi:hypothetical protein F2Q68_00013057 [Brassica cretica]|uniref:Uncharacterized protein n=1 Tax=Brassica cretica TaxID=69181 RepID=A0A8S9HFC0_BRACR|nr:hypothetical protein F2Q68_00013057 [Brassica cretica]
MAMVEEPILSRLDRIDVMVRKLEEMKGSSPRSSSPSTPSSGTQPSSLDLSSPRSVGKVQCRPMEQVIEETERKGTLLERLNNVEEQVLKLCLKFEEEVEEESKRDGFFISSQTKSLRRSAITSRLTPRVLRRGSSQALLILSSATTAKLLSAQLLPRSSHVLEAHFSLCIFSGGKRRKGLFRYDRRLCKNEEAKKVIAEAWVGDPDASVMERLASTRSAISA